MITHEKLKEVLDYNSETGIFVWKIIRSGITVGKIAGHRNQSGHRVIAIDKKIYYASRLAWLYVYGKWPINLIDHIDHNTDNDRIKNLRDVTRMGNAQNQIKAQKSNKSTGLLGSSYNKRLKKYSAQITINKKIVYLGLFKTAKEAHQKYLQVKRQYHPYNTL